MVDKSRRYVYGPEGTLQALGHPDIKLTGSLTVNGLPLGSYTSTGSSYICPDLLRYEQLGAADGWRGRVVRAFFRLLRWWPPNP